MSGPSATLYPAGTWNSDGAGSDSDCAEKYAPERPRPVSHVAGLFASSVDCARTDGRKRIPGSLIKSKNLMPRRFPLGHESLSRRRSGRAGLSVAGAAFNRTP